jgi:hypothetical protein
MIPQKPHYQEVERVSEKPWLLWEKAESGDLTPIREECSRTVFSTPLTSLFAS